MRKAKEIKEVKTELDKRERDKKLIANLRANDSAEAVLEYQKATEREKERLVAEGKLRKKITYDKRLRLIIVEYLPV